MHIYPLDHKLTTTTKNKHSPTPLTVYLVGGAVRDTLLKYPIKDKDYLVVGSTISQMLDHGFQKVGKDFPVFIHPKTKEEYALARTERKQGVGYDGFICDFAPTVTLEEDLKRRDLTINAMAMSEKGEITDPYHGQEDIQNKILRHVSDAFIEDPTRVLRVARFAARYHHIGFTIAPETLKMMALISKSGELSNLVTERVWQEIFSTLGENNPEIFFKTLHEVGALKVIWPELDKLWGIPNPAFWHPEICSGIHTMMVLQQAVKLTQQALLESKKSAKANQTFGTPFNDDIATSIRFAALCHDLGKGLTPSNEWPSHHGHEAAGIPLVERICQQLKAPNHYKQLTFLVCEYHLHCHKAFQLNAQEILEIFNHIDVWRKPEQFNFFIMACKADFLGRLGFDKRPYPQENFLRDAMQKALTVKATAFIEQGLVGEQIKEKIQQARASAINEVIEQYKLTAPL